ncbi:phospho-N-acetylmuramoyl-pentapeptide-transferase [Ornithobacterium rhinotracheale]|uniref:phospho-N-acetylmuramoyl-pentapeptide- transferase n=1 Tax=Ornithobacterium rhinotracheale TaxID=28251 RepID=UPI00129C25ED|nr:phospho-N-acetylmuramoyl-pentapeptide-transferase [Ornithobacterium rhinotracheale]MRJ09995.1 phospho-N-acetylmuramoyl-pentapeptide-transferase [Ornithobacterium rhinotracheale]
MLYYFFEYIHQYIDVPGINMIRSTTFRMAMSVLTSLFIALFFGKKIIHYLRVKQLGETVRDLGLVGQKEKEGTPTMGGLIIIIATLIPALLFTKLNNVYIIILLISLLWMGTIGFLDDYIKVFRKNKAGLAGKFKVLGQVGLGLIVGSMLYFSPEVTVRQQIHTPQSNTRLLTADELFGEPEQSNLTNIPFFKDNELNYDSLLFWMDKEDATKFGWLIFIPVVIFIITAVSNGSNLTDGIDGLAAGSSVIIMGALALFAWVSGNFIFADYLNILYIPRVEEVMVFCGGFIGALIGFLWYNTYPAQVFMGDTGSLTIGGLIAVIAVIVRKELLLPILCGIFLAESLSVLMQVSYFKYTKKRFGAGKRIFLMSPLHHHFQKLAYHESKIVNRFLIIGFILAVISIITLKIR